MQSSKAFDTRGILTTTASGVHERLKTNSTAIKIAKETTNNQSIKGKMNSRQENRSKLSFTARIITKYSLERFLSICGEKMSKAFLSSISL